MTSRVTYLDGLRGVAILLVISYHAYARWPELVPYGAAYAHFPIVRSGWLGVNLFFLISGFVILMTLDKCSTRAEFLFRRWLRLFPAMLICSLLIFFTAPYFEERPQGSPTFLSLIPGLTFIDFNWWQALLGFPAKPLEGAFWSLYVEVEFYVFAAWIYFWKGSTRLISSLVAVYLLAVLCRMGNIYFGGGLVTKADQLVDALLFKHFGWFAAGCAFYLFAKARDFRWFYAGLGIALLSALFLDDLTRMHTRGGYLVAIFFALAVINKTVQSCLSARFLVFVGFVSYPLYLLHENMMVSMIVKLGRVAIGVPQAMYPVLPVIALLVLSYLVARFGEPSLRSAILRFAQPGLRRSKAI